MHWNILGPLSHEIYNKMFGTSFICITEGPNKHKRNWVTKKLGCKDKCIWGSEASVGKQEDEEKPFSPVISLSPCQPQKTWLLHVAAKGYWELKHALELQNKAHYKWHRNTTGNGNILVEFQGFWTRCYKRNPSLSAVSSKTPFNIKKPRTHPICAVFIFFFLSSCLLHLSLHVFCWIYCLLTLCLTWSHSFS